MVTSLPEPEVERLFEDQTSSHMHTHTCKGDLLLFTLTSRYTVFVYQSIQHFT
jgi:hypothetical protein